MLQRHNNTVAYNTYDGLYFYNDGFTEGITISNNIIAFNGYGIEQDLWGGGSIAIAYNGVYGNTYGDYWDWRAEGPFSPDPGTGSISDDPLFVSEEDFHLAPESPCVDAGDPAAAYAREPEPNGGRLNMGSYGNTEEATPSTYRPPANYEEWIARYDTGGATAPEDDADGDGWSNAAEYEFYKSGEPSSPVNAAQGGQAIRLEAGWNLIGIAADVCYYEEQPGDAERAMIPVSDPDGYVEVPGIYDLLDSMGVAGSVERITGWHPDPSGEGKAPVNWENQPELDTLAYLAGGYGYWVKASEACTWTFPGRPRLKGVAGSVGVPIRPGWNLMGVLLAKTHYEVATDAPSSSVGSDETGRAAEPVMSDYLLNMVRVAGSQAPGSVDALVTFDSVRPYVHTYYRDIPAFLQTLKYAGPGLGMAVKIGGGVTSTDDIAIMYPAE